jgi:acetyl esterase/lipase
VSRRPGCLLLVLSGMLCLLAVWVLLPPFTYPALVLAVGAPEVGVWIILVSLIIVGLARRENGRARTAGPTWLFAAAAIAFSAVPLIQFPSTARRFDETMRAVLGPGYFTGLPAATRARMRARPLDPLDLFAGLRAGPSRVTRGIPFAVNDGVRLTMDVYRPASPGSYPAVVQVYGGAWQRGTPADNGTFASYLASHGYVVFAIDYRHAPRWPWPAQLADVRAALSWIGEHGKEHDADTGRLAILGRSSGAQIAMVAAFAPGAPPVRAVVSYYGPVDLIEGYRRPPRPDPLDVRMIEEAFLGGSPDAVRERYQEASPITYVVRQLPPTLLIYGKRDHVVEARFGAMLHRRLQATGTTSIFLEIPWAEHAFDAVSGGPSAQLALFYTERFLAWATSPGSPRP